MNIPSPGRPWLFSPRFDGLLILGPAFFSVGAVLLLPVGAREELAAAPWMWLLVVVGIDVAHVYTTLFRTYLDRAEVESRWGLYFGVPVACWIIGVCLYSLDALAFWRALAYLAVFHFVRQQYGFFALYGRSRSALSSKFWQLDRVMIYAATLVPLVFWHSRSRDFAWFVEGDFLRLPWSWIGEAALFVYAALWIAYVMKEMWVFRRSGEFNLPQNLLLVGTALSWLVGIVLFNDDLIFTVTNVVAHGIPYTALVWATSGRERVPGRWAPLFFLGLVLLLAFVEEGFWDGLIWGEHGELFPGFSSFSVVRNPEILKLLVPLLALPQATHYVLDGFIWKKRPSPAASVAGLPLERAVG